MRVYNIEEITVKIKQAEVKYQRAQRNDNRQLVLFLKRDIEYLRTIKDQLESDKN